MACVHQRPNGYRAFLVGRSSPSAPNTIGWVDLSDDLKVIGESPAPILEPRPNTFDSAGMLAPCVIRIDEQTLHLYYVGTTTGPPLVVNVEPGLAVSDDDGATWKRPNDGPFLKKDDKDPAGVGSVFVIPGKNQPWLMWYTSIDPPVNLFGKPITKRFFIKYAESDDGIHWRKPPDNHVLDIDGYSTTSRPMIVPEPGGYRMFYSFKQAHEGRLLPANYRICEAQSSDLQTWYDQGVALDVSESGWDSSMVAYAWVVPRGNEYLMFYSGNDFGVTGTGLAIGRVELADEVLQRTEAH